MTIDLSWIGRELGPSPLTRTPETCTAGPRGLARLTRYDESRRATLVFDRRCELVNAPLDLERSGSDGIL